MTRPPKDIAASVSARLLARSRSSGENHQFLLRRYAGERFLYRLGVSAYRDRFVLKGALLFGLWGGAAQRPTRDLDFAGYGDSDIPSLLTSIREICDAPENEDGVRFELSDVQARPIRDEAEYGGIRITFEARLGPARVPIQIDVGFGDAIHPAPAYQEYPTLLEGSPRPTIRAYPQEAVIAEKLHAMVELGERNSRFKDFYDLYTLASRFPFDGATLSAAIRATFERRNRPIDDPPPLALSFAFFADASRSALWRGYLTRNGLSEVPANFVEVGELLQGFLAPVWTAVAARSDFSRAWSIGGPWRAA